MNILHIDSATTGAASVTRALTAKIVDKLTTDNPDAIVVYRDLGTEPLAHLNPVITGAIRFPEEDMTDDMKAAAATERKVLDEFLAADVVVIGAPMYNFTIPSNLKSWIDRLGVPRVTFRYSENGPEGLAGGRRVIVASAAGGAYQPGNAPLTFHEGLLEAFLNFIGVTDVTFVRGHGVGAVGPEQALADAEDQIAAL
ncbi:FMN-dependent NADH-azoreductase [Croceicoccus ponticola]|uniref:FMN dependent NADH:quinone oxidoreductase n=1 Tax=Croceicoccus ponticola TaxID=2217664 RepID=A0A437H032_9SPHN|nr:NAD(P)H-dependent oxidoreductase [Croceicoccus ponticola]RVQ68902.1 FMN-dependent NADH-azoreductase [Croceicoccus ponticola]